MAGNTVRLHRVLRAPPERVYRAFLNAEALVKWIPPDGFTAKVHHMDARVGGSFRMSFTGEGFLEGGVLRDRAECGSGRYSRRDSRRDVLPRLAGFARAARKARRAGNS